MPEEFAVAIGITLVAALYASVGHGGASGYLAVMALLGVAPASMKPAALALNILVSSMATVAFFRAGAFSWRLFWPFAVVSIPAAYAGGLVAATVWIYRPLLGLVLLYSAAYSLRRAVSSPVAAATPPALRVALPVGAGLGLLSGLTGVGGGIFLSPLMLLMRWADPKTISAVAAPFILVNSIAGLTGVLSRGATLPASLPLWLAAAALGGGLGSLLGSRRMAPRAILYALAVVLAVAGGKLLLAAG
jgi:uncharacterized membrane protein YfcA